MPSSTKVYVEGKVIVVDRRAALITEVTKDYDRIEYAFVESDGSIGHGGHFRSWEAEKLGIKVIDLAKKRTVVDLPPEWKERAVAYEAEKAKDAAAQREMHDEWEPETHPTYGFVQVSRVSGHTALFGSPFKHQHYMTMTIGRSVRHRNLGRDRHFGGLSHGLVEIAMSEAQWANLLSSVGMGAGVPCTLRYVGGQEQGDCPEQEEVNRFHEDIERDMKNAAKFMGEALQKLQALVEDKAPSKEKRKEALAALVKAGRQLEDSAPFMAEQLHERMATIVHEAKTEVEAYVLRTIVETGVQKLAEMNSKDGKAELPFSFNTPDSPKPSPKLVEGKTEVKKP